MNYDKNDSDNLTTLRSYNASGTGYLHNLTYSYISGTNKLMNRDGSGTDYTYDASGNLLTDTYNSITATTYYDHLNVPSQVTVSSTRLIKYGYDENVQRVYKNTEGSLRYYVHGMDGQIMAEYDNSKALVNWQLGGFGFKTKTGGNVKSYYYLKDHIGNIRVTIDQDAVVVTKDDYYPFGLQMGGLSYNNGNPNVSLR